MYYKIPRSLVAGLIGFLLQIPAHGESLLLSTTADAVGTYDSSTALYQALRQDDTSINVGRQGANAIYHQAAVFPFQLPNLGLVANPFQNADFSFRLNAKDSVSSFNADVYGLPVKTSSTVIPTTASATNAGDFFMGGLAGGPADDPKPWVIKIQNNILTANSNLGMISTNLSGSAQLAAYLNAAYDSGNGVGKWVFLRLSTDAVPGGAHRYNVLTTDNATVGNHPRIRYNFEPEPDLLGRPFIWVRNSEKTGILAKISGNPWATNVYNGMVSRVATALGSHQSTRDTFLRQIPVEWTLSPAKFKTIPAYTENSVRYAAETKFNNALDCAVLYYLTGDANYARCAADILHNSVKTLLPVAASTSTGNGGWIFQSDFLKEARVTGTQLAIVYDFLRSYLESNQVYDVQTAGMVDFNFSTAQSVFRKLYQLARDHGQKESNWSALMATTMLNNLLALDDEAERATALQVYLTTGTSRQASLQYDYRHYSQAENIWPESLQYASAVGGIRTTHMVLLERYDPTLALFNTYSNFPLSLPRVSYMRYPNGEQISFGDGRRPGSNGPLFVYELAYQHALARGRADLTSFFGQLINGAVADGIYNRSSLNNYGTLGLQNEPLQLLWQAAVIAEPAVTPELPRTDRLPFGGIALQRNPAPTNNPNFGLMAFVGGAAFVHSHASGMSMELFGMGQVLGAKSGRTSYGTTDHENYYRVFASNNTVIVNGGSRGSGGWQDIAINTVQTVTMEPQPFAQAVSPDHSFTTSSFVDDKGTLAQGTQQRTMAIVRTSPTSGFYVDFFRTRSTVTNRTATTLNGNVTNQYHDYIYRNVGDLNPEVLVDGVPAQFVSQANRFQNDIGDSYQQPGWRYFTNTVVTHPATQSMRARFVATVSGQDRCMTMHMPAVASREIARVSSPAIVDAPSPYSSARAPALVIRQIGDTWDKPFTTVYEPHFGTSGGTVQNVTQLLRGNLVVGVKVDSTVDGKDLVHYVISHPTATETYTDSSIGLSFTGRFGVISSNGDGSMALYLGQGSSASYLGNSLSTVSGANSQAAGVFVPGEPPVVTANAPMNAVAAPVIGATWVPTAASSGLDWTNNANWNPATFPNGLGSVASLNIDITGNQTINVNNPITLGELIVGDSNGSQTTLLQKNTKGSFTFDQLDTAMAYLTRTGGGTGTVTLKDDLHITLNENLTVRLADGSASSTMTIAGSLSGLGRSLIKESPTLGLTLSGNNAYTGSTSIDGGKLTLSGSGTLGNDADLNLNGGQLDLGTLSSSVAAVSITTAATSGDTISNGSLTGTSYAASNTTGNAIVSANLLDNATAGFTKSGAGTTTLAGTNTYSGTTALTGGVLRLNSSGALGGGNLTLSGGGVIGLEAGNFSRSHGSGNSQFQWAGNGGFAAYGAARTVSPGTLSWGTSTLLGKTLILSHSTADATLIWGSNIAIAGGSRTIQVNDGSAAIDARINGVISAAGTLNKTGAGTLAVSSTNTFTGGLVINGGTLQLGNGGTTGNFNAISSIAITSGTLAINRSNAFNQAIDLANKIISGAGSFVQTGSGTTTLTLANTYSGTTSINGGTLALGASNVLPDATAVSIGDATLDAATFTDTVGTLNITGNAKINLATGAALAFADSSAIDWTGGTLTLSGTFVSGSSLRFDTNSSGLSSAQLALITASGFGPFTLDASGYLIANESPPASYETWAATHAPNTGSNPNADEDGDGVPNAVEYILGGSNGTNDLAKLPVISTHDGNLIFTFKRDQISIDSSTTVTIEVGNDLATWNVPPSPYAVPDTDTGPVNPGVTVVKDSPAPGVDTVTLTLPNIPHPRKFIRLKVTP